MMFCPEHMEVERGEPGGVGGALSLGGLDLGPRWVVGLAGDGQCQAQWWRWWLDKSGGVCWCCTQRCASAAMAFSSMGLVCGGSGPRRPDLQVAASIVGRMGSVVVGRGLVAVVWLVSARGGLLRHTAGLRPCFRPVAGADDG